MELPVALNPIGDLGEFLAREDRALVFDCGDAEGLAERILWAAENPEGLARMACRAREAANAEFSLSVTTAPLASWVGEPVRAPDRTGSTWTSSPLDYADPWQRIALRAQRLPGVRRSRTLRRIWRSWKPGSGD